MDGISQQILVARTIADVNPEQPTSFPANDNDVESDYIQNIPLDADFAPPLRISRRLHATEPPNDNDELNNGYLKRTLQNHLNGRHIGTAEAIALSITHTTNDLKVWTLISQIKFNATFPWLTEEEHSEIDLRQIAYAGKDINGCGPRYDAVEYRHTGSVYVGIIHLLLEVPHPDNKAVVEQFGHRRYEYTLTDETNGDVLLDCMSSTDVRRVLVVVRGYHDLTLRNSILTTESLVEDTPDERRLAKFLFYEG
eukprot:IDg2645t1